MLNSPRVDNKSKNKKMIFETSEGNRRASGYINDFILFSDKKI